MGSPSSLDFDVVGVDSADFAEELEADGNRVKLTAARFFSDNSCAGFPPLQVV
jgi:hypothetical protein